MKELEFEIEEHRWNRFILTVTDEEKFKEELMEWLREHNSLQFSDLFDNFNSIPYSATKWASMWNFWLSRLKTPEWASKERMKGLKTT